MLLARALYRQPRILVLDEATCHLDPVNERAITSSLAQLKLTRLVIAHRSETIAAAQKVVQVHEGQLRVIERAGCVESAFESGHRVQRGGQRPAPDLGGQALREQPQLAGS